MGCCNSKPKCVICNNIADRILVPCGHYVLCYSCCQELSKYRHEPKYLRLRIDLDEECGLQCSICRSISIPKTVYM